MKYFAVVYQMGKVASTSIVDTLDALEAVEAVQSHFFGDKALAEIIPLITDPDISEYFFKHSFGQFVENVKITRNVNMIRSGKVPGTRLLVISLARDPISWIRSSIVQDITGYLPVLAMVASAAGKPPVDDAEKVRIGLPIFLEASCNILEKFGGIDAFQSNKSAAGSGFDGTILEGIYEARRMFMMLLRPADWFRGHFETAIGFPVVSMTAKDNVWQLAEQNADFVIVRYEDFKIALPRYLAERGICQIEHFSSKNISESKIFADDIAAVFSSPYGERLRALYSETRYSRTFAYT